MPVRAFFFQKKVRCSVRILAAIDGWNEAASIAEDNTDDVVRSTIEEVANFEFHCFWLLARVTVLFVYRQQLICIDALQRYPEQCAPLVRYRAIAAAGCCRVWWRGGRQKLR